MSSRLNFKYCLALSASLLTISQSAHATEETTDPYVGNLLGNWGGIRSKMADAGVDATVEYKADILDNVSGGIKRGSNYLDNLDVKFALDGEKLFGIAGNRSFIYFLNNDGGKPNGKRIGSAQGVDNFETPTNTAKLYEAWTEQSFLNNKFSVLVGLHDLNSEFDTTDLTGNFVQPTPQLGQTLAQSGVNGPSVFPTTSLAARAKINPTQESYVSFAAFDGVPGNPSRPHGTHIDISSNDGMLLISEAGIAPKLPDSEIAANKVAVGIWEYTKKADDLVDVDTSGNPVKRRMDGAYFLSSYQAYHNKDAGHDIGLFFRAGVADGNTAQVDWDYETGIVGNGWVPTRPDSEIGLALSQAHNDDKYIQSVSGVSDRNEYAVELYYRDKLINGISVQPDLQYVMNPGTNPAVSDAAIIGIRFDINF